MSQPALAILIWIAVNITSVMQSVVFVLHSESSDIIEVYFYKIDAYVGGL
jgi:hypothetical protein